MLNIEADIIVFFYQEYWSQRHLVNLVTFPPFCIFPGAVVWSSAGAGIAGNTTRWGGDTHPHVNKE